MCKKRQEKDVQEGRADTHSEVMIEVRFTLFFLTQTHALKHSTGRKKDLAFITLFPPFPLQQRYHYEREKKSGTRSPPNERQREKSKRRSFREG